MRINREQTAGLIIDIQEKLFPHMSQNEVLLLRCAILIEGLQVLAVPLLITEQYPRGLGSTVHQISELMKQQPVIEKIAFSCCDEPGVMQSPVFQTRKTVIVCGIEAHVCVLQTVIDLLEAGYKPVVVEDCISSRNPEDKHLHYFCIQVRRNTAIWELSERTMCCWCFPIQAKQGKFLNL